MKRFGIGLLTLLATTTVASAQQYPKCTFGIWEIGDRCVLRRGVICQRVGISGYQKDVGGDWKCWRTKRRKKRRR